MPITELQHCKLHGDVTHRYRETRHRSNNVVYGRWECTECTRLMYRDRLRKDKIKAIGYLGGKCMDCGQSFEDHPSVFDFHHRDPSEKKRKPSALFGCTWEKLKAELDKCDLLCANCHRIRHSEEGYPHSI